MTGERRMIWFFGLSISRMSGSSDSGFGSGFGGGGEYLGEAAANAAATSGDIARVRRGPAGGDVFSFSSGFGASTGEVAGFAADWAEAIGPGAVTPRTNAAS